MAWNDYVYDVNNGSKFESSRYQVYFDTIYENKPQIKDMQYALNVPNYLEYEIEAITGGDDELYAIMWFEISEGYNIDATGRGLNDVALSYTPSLNLPTLDYSDIGDSLLYPITSSGSPNRTCFLQPTQLIERHVSTNVPVVAVCADTIYNEDQQIIYDVNMARQAMHLYALTGDWDEYIQPFIDDGYALSVNYTPTPEPEPTTEYFTIYNTGQKGIFTKKGYTMTDGPYYRWVRVKLRTSSSVDGRMSFYREGLSDGIIKLIPVIGADIYSCEYSTNGGATWNESAVFPYDYIYGERINEMGEMIHATRTGIGGDTGVPLFATRELAEGWVNHDPSVDISDALNYEDIANRYKIINPTGAEEIATTMGDGSYLRNYFSQELVCSQGAIYEISEAFFDVGPQGIWEQIKPAIEMMGSNPIDVICGLKWFPFDLSTVLTGLASPQNYIYFGGYQFNLPSATVMKVINHGGYLDMGSFTIKDAFPNPSDFRNFEPFCKMKIYVPTVGIQDLSYNKYRGKTVSVRLYVDIKSGSTLIALMADGVLYDYFNGSCGVDIPITLTDKAQLGQAQLRNISNLAGVGINMGTAAATADIGSAVAGFANFETTMMDVNNTTADQFNVTKGGSSPMGNGCFLPNYIYLIFEYIKTDETSNLNQLEGRVTNRSGTLNSFSGYLQIDSINLRTTADMSENEKNEFVNLLQSGIFI